MPGVWLPPKVAAEHAESTLALDAEREEMLDAEMSRLFGYVREFEKRLREIDPYLHLVLAKDNAQHPDLLPGRWHLVRHNPGAPASVIRICGPHGEYEEPSASVIDRLLEQDWWSDGVMRERGRRQARELQAKTKAADARRQEMREEFALRLKAKTNPGVLFGDNRWTYRAKAKQGRKAA